MIHCRRYALFAAPRHEGGLGWHDFVGMFDSLDEAQDAFTRPPSDMDGQVVDLLNQRIVAENKSLRPGWEPVA